MCRSGELCHATRQRTDAIPKESSDRRVAVIPSEGPKAPQSTNYCHSGRSGRRPRSRGIAGVRVEGLRPLYPEEEDTKTPITRISRKNAHSPSTRTVATLARPSFPVEGFCGIGEIRGHLRQVFSGPPARENSPLPGRRRFLDCAAPVGMTNGTVNPYALARASVAFVIASICMTTSPSATVVLRCEAKVERRVRTPRPPRLSAALEVACARDPDGTLPVAIGG